MKKFLQILTIISLTILSFSGCTPAAKEKKSAEDSTLKNGIYKAEFDKFDDHGWKPTLEMEIKDGKITRATFDYINTDGKFKTEDEDYAKAMKEASGTTPAEASGKLDDDLVKKQDVDKIDTVAGATHSTENFKKLAKAAIANAKKGDTSTVIVEFK